MLLLLREKRQNPTKRYSEEAFLINKSFVLFGRATLCNVSKCQTPPTQIVFVWIGSYNWASTNTVGKERYCCIWRSVGIGWRNWRITFSCCTSTRFYPAIGGFVKNSIKKLAIQSCKLILYWSEKMYCKLYCFFYSVTITASAASSASTPASGSLPPLPQPHHDTSVIVLWFD